MIGVVVALLLATGAALPGLDAYDEIITALLRRWDVAGAGLAVARGDKLMLVRGYGVADRSKDTPVEPTSMFRLASLSKTVTAVAVLQLVQDGRLKLDDPVLPILGDLGPRPGKMADPRVRDITVRHLLQHAGGFDRAKTGDAVFLPHALDAARRQRAPLPPDCPTVARDTLERKLDFTPGERIGYSNVGYCILGRVIERVAGTPYEEHVRTRILAPAGVTRMKIGRTLTAADGEVTYYDHREAKQEKAMPGLGLTLAPRPYGVFAIETMDSYGGWIATPVDYLRFVLSIDGRRGAAVLNAAALAEMNAPSRLTSASMADTDAADDGDTFGLGIRVRRVKNGVNLWHGGSLPGTSTLAVRTSDGFTWVVLLNGRPPDRDRRAFRRELDRALWTAKTSVKKWPEGDLFGSP